MHCGNTFCWPTEKFNHFLPSRFGISDQMGCDIQGLSKAILKLFYSLNRVCFGKFKHRQIMHRNHPVLSIRWQKIVGCVKYLSMTSTLPIPILGPARKFETTFATRGSHLE